MNSTILAKIKKYHLNYYPQSDLSLLEKQNYDNKFIFLSQLLDQYWILITLPINERNVIIQRTPLYYVILLYSVDRDLHNFLRRKLETYYMEFFTPIFQEYVTNRYNEILQDPVLSQQLKD